MKVLRFLVSSTRPGMQRAGYNAGHYIVTYTMDWVHDVRILAHCSSMEVNEGLRCPVHAADAFANNFATYFTTRWTFMYLHKSHILSFRCFLLLHHQHPLLFQHRCQTSILVHTHQYIRPSHKFLVNV